MGTRSRRILNLLGLPKACPSQLQPAIKKPLCANEINNVSQVIFRPDSSSHSNMSTTRENCSEDKTSKSQYPPSEYDLKQDAKAIRQTDIEIPPNILVGPSKLLPAITNQNKIENPLSENEINNVSQVIFRPDSSSHSNMSTTRENCSEDKTSKSQYPPSEYDLKQDAKAIRQTDIEIPPNILVGPSKLLPAITNQNKIENPLSENEINNVSQVIFRPDSFSHSNMSTTRENCSEDKTSESQYPPSEYDLKQDAKAIRQTDIEIPPNILVGPSKLLPAITNQNKIENPLRENEINNESQVIFRPDSFSHSNMSTTRENCSEDKTSGSEYPPSEYDLKQDDIILVGPSKLLPAITNQNKIENPLSANKINIVSQVFFRADSSNVSTTSEDISEDKTSGSEYQPSEDDSMKSDQSNKQRNITPKTVNKNILNKKRIKQNINITSHSNPSQFPDSTTSDFIDLSPSCTLNSQQNVPSSTVYDTNRESVIDNHTVKIMTSIKEEGKLVRNKGHACYFCQRIVQNAARHFELLHNKESEVAKLLAKPKHSKERRDGFSNLIRAGNFYHNTEVLATKRGNLILVRRPTENEIKFLTPADYGPCPHCLGFMLKKHLWHHVKNSCTAKPQKENENTGRHIIAESHALLNDAFGRDFSIDYVTNILSKLRDDDIGTYCKEDLLIQRFGAMMFEKHGTTQCEQIRQSMRQLARLTKLREIDNSQKQLTDFLVPQMFDRVIQATKSLCVTHQNVALRPEFELPSLALKIGYALKKCAGIKRGSCLRSGNLSGNESLLCFLNLMDLEWNVRISSNALATLYTRKINAAQLLPLTSDLIKLSSYLNKEMAQENISLTECPTGKTWSRLAFLTLSKIILFNKRRSGEAARMTLVAYSSRPKWSDQSTEELKQSLTDFEKKLADQLTLVEIVGKKGRKVPVLLTQDVKSSVDKLIQTRGEVNISIKNPFIFARMGDSLLSLRGHDCLRKACLNAGLESPEAITSTKLRKYTATVCQVFNLSENDYDWLARHLGHDVRVHREFYRLHESAVELTKVSRILIAVENGQVNKFAGKSLDEINLDDFPTEMVYTDDYDDDDDDNGEEATPTQESVEENKDLNQSEYMGAIKKPRIELAFKKRSVVQVAPREAVAKSKTSDRRVWSSEEKEAVLKFFKGSIKRGTVPRKQDCTKCIEESNGILAQRSWTHVKYYIKNHLDNLKKQKPKIL